MFDSIKSALQRSRTLHEVRGMSARELDDLGLSRGEVEDFVMIPEATADRLGRMAAIFGMDRQAIRARTDDHLAMLKTCNRCADRTACDLALTRGDLRRPQDCGFCPNAAMLGETPLAA